jgi:hypothetical protein
MKNMQTTFGSIASNPSSQAQSTRLQQKKCARISKQNKTIIQSMKQCRWTTKKNMTNKTAALPTCLQGAGKCQLSRCSGARRLRGAWRW